jgi:endonuclease YncB( thermonuclease family)
MEDDNCNQEIQKKLENINNDDISLFSLNGKIVLGKVVEMYDGDTCKIVLAINNNLQKFNCRLLGLDTPEMKPPADKPNRDIEILNAHKCRNKLLQLTTTCNCDINSILKKPDVKSLLKTNKKIIQVKCHEFDKYGRLLVELLTVDDNANKTVNQILVDEGYAKAYDGGTKDVFTY